MAEPGVDLKLQWYKALFAEDCVQVKELLTKNEKLLYEGWKADAQASLQFKLERSWAGRTAMHVAARRGDVKLMQLILNLCPVSDSGGDKGAEGSTVCKLLELVDGDYELDALAMAVVNGNDDIVNLLTMSSQRDSRSTLPNNSLEAPGGSTPSQPADSHKHEENEGALDQEIAEGVSKDVIANSIPSKSTSWFSNRLELGNGDNESDAQAVVKFLRESSPPTYPLTRSDSSHEAEGGSVPKQPAPRDHGENQKLLRKITKQVLEQTAESLAKAAVNLVLKSSRQVDRGSFLHQPDAHELEASGAALLLESLKKMYDEDCNFNFLDMDIYFFHFTFSTWLSTTSREVVIKPIQRSIFSRARESKESSTLLEYLLFELWDGQGRTPLHVAVDSRKVDNFLDIIPPPGKDVQGRDYNYLNITDRAGRTPLCRAAAQGYYFAVKHLRSDRRTDLLAKTVCKANQWGANVDIDRLSWTNGFKSDCVFVPGEKLRRKAFNNDSNAQGGPGPYIEPLEEIFSTALHVAIIHKHTHIVKLLLDPTQDHEEEASISPAARAWKDMYTRVVKRLFNLKRGHKEEEDDLEASDLDGNQKGADGNCKDEVDSNLTPENIRKLCEAECGRRFPWPVVSALQGDGDNRYAIQSTATPIQLTVLVGSIPILQSLLKEKDERPNEMGLSGSTTFPNFLLAAAKGTPGVIKAFLDRQEGNFDPLIKDSFKNTALHHALKGNNVQFHPHLVDFVGCHHVFSWRWANNDWVSQWLAHPEEVSQLDDRKSMKANPEPNTSSDRKSAIQANQEIKGSTKPVEVENKKQELQQEKYGPRMGSINLLLEAGIDIWDKNVQERTANPEPDASDEFVQWWYEKVAGKTLEEQEKLNAAANAISVTAALVATASYLGPLQPPLGYGDHDSGLQLSNVAVRIFVVCNSLSFYLALAAIMLALLPSLPLAKESMFRELVRTRTLVAISVAVLFPSIVCVLIAFAASYVAVTPDHGLTHRGLSTITMVVGGFVCILVMIKFFTRLLKVLKHLPIDVAKEIAGFAW